MAGDTAVYKLLPVVVAEYSSAPRRAPPLGPSASCFS